MLRSHYTKLNWLQWTWNRRYDNCYDGCGDVYGRAQGLAAPLTLIPTLFLTITLTRPHTSIVQFICRERVLTRRKVRRDRRRTLTDRRWCCLLLWTLSARAVATRRGDDALWPWRIFRLRVTRCVYNVPRMRFFIEKTMYFAIDNTECATIARRFSTA